MIEQAKNVMVQSGATWVLWLLIALSVASLAVVLDRARLFWAQRGSVAALVHELHRLLGAGELTEARARLARERGSASRVALAGLSRWGEGGEALREAMAAAAGLERARLEKRLLFLGTVGNNAPFVGLLGTVIGIVGAFEELGKAGVSRASAGVAPERVMATIAEALVATAVGLIVAIPAVALFNSFQGKLASVLADAEILGHVVLAHATREPAEER